MINEKYINADNKLHLTKTIISGIRMSGAIVFIIIYDLYSGMTVMMQRIEKSYMPHNSNGKTDFPKRTMVTPA